MLNWIADEEEHASFLVLILILDEEEQHTSFLMLNLLTKMNMIFSLMLKFVDEETALFV